MAEKITEIPFQITTELQNVLQRINPDEVVKLVDAIIHTRHLFIDGRGRSGLMMRAFAIRLTHLDIHCHVVGESTTPSLQADDLLLVGSGSGETVTPLLTAKTAKNAGGRVAVLTSRRKSAMASLADIVVVIPAPVRESSDIEPVTTIQPMGSLFEQSLLILLDSIVIILQERLNLDEKTMMTRHSNLE